MLTCACGQSQVNSDRLADTADSDVLEVVDADSGQDEDSLPNAGDEDMEEEILDPVDSGLEIEGNIFETNFFGYGQVNYIINDVKCADSMEGAGIDREAYELSGSSPCDYYIAVTLTLENVDVSTDENELINCFSLHIPTEDEEAYSVYLWGEPLYFDKGGQANPDPKSYFEYVLPGVGETQEMVIAFGLTGEERSAILDNQIPLYLQYNFEPYYMMRIDDKL